VRQVLGVTPLAITPVISNSTSHALRRNGLIRLAASIAAATLLLFLVGYKLTT
jgi:hypothetical protein